MTPPGFCIHQLRCSGSLCNLNTPEPDYPHNIREQITPAGGLKWGAETSQYTAVTAAGALLCKNKRAPSQMYVGFLCVCVWL